MTRSMEDVVALLRNRLNTCGYGREELWKLIIQSSIEDIDNNNINSKLSFEKWLSAIPTFAPISNDECKSVYTRLVGRYTGERQKYLEFSDFQNLFPDKEIKPHEPNHQPLMKLITEYCKTKKITLEFLFRNMAMLHSSNTPKPKFRKSTPTDKMFVSKEGLRKTINSLIVKYSSSIIIDDKNWRDRYVFGISEFNLNSLFDFLDVNGDGRLTIDDFRESFKKLLNIENGEEEKKNGDNNDEKKKDIPVVVSEEERAVVRDLQTLFSSKDTSDQSIRKSLIQILKKHNIKTSDTKIIKSLCDFCIQEAERIDLNRSNSLMKLPSAFSWQKLVILFFLGIFFGYLFLIRTGLMSFDSPCDRPLPSFPGS